MEPERRVLSTREVRASATGGKLKVGGYAATYGVLSAPIQPGVKERIAKGAFDRVLRGKPDVVATFNHDANIVLGRTTSGTLQLRSDDTGLAFECDLPNTSTARDLYESVQRGDINGCSFAFKLDSGMDSFLTAEDEERGSTIIVRTINDFSNLYDVSICTNPCYPGTSVDARSKHVVSAELRSRIDKVIAAKVRTQ
jgi:HK97 family phage prohead protease